MRTTEDGPCLRRMLGFWFGAGPHTPAQRVWPTYAPLRSQDGDPTHGAYDVVSGLYPVLTLRDSQGNEVRITRVPGQAPRIARPAARSG